MEIRETRKKSFNLPMIYILILTAGFVYSIFSSNLKSACAAAMGIVFIASIAFVKNTYLRYAIIYSVIFAFIFLELRVIHGFFDLLLLFVLSALTVKIRKKEEGIIVLFVGVAAFIEMYVLGAPVWLAVLCVFIGMVIPVLRRKKV